jgi:mitogen-activated protein kinase kinase kinase
MLKFVDFGAAAVNTGKVASRGDTAQRSTEADFVGTPMYLAPEVVKHEKGGLFGARDVWAVGCVILELITGRKPWVGFDNEWCASALTPLIHVLNKLHSRAIMFHIAVTRDPPQLPEPTDDSLAMVDFVQKCLTLDATRRPAAHDLLEHEWMRACRSMLAQYAAIDTSEMPLADSGILSV